MSKALNSKNLLSEIERDSDAMVVAGFETEHEAEESEQFAQRVMGICGRTCKNCGEEVSRRERTCGTCGCDL